MTPKKLTPLDQVEVKGTYDPATVNLSELRDVHHRVQWWEFMFLVSPRGKVWVKAGEGEARLTGIKFVGAECQPEAEITMTFTGETDETDQVSRVRRGEVLDDAVRPGGS